MNPSPNLHPVTITLNNRPVKLHDHKTTGLEIKEAAVDQGVSIQVSFALFRITGNAQHPVRNDEEITVHNDERFRAVAADDNS